MGTEFEVLREIFVERHFAAGWLGMAFGVISGAVMGLFFHREDWLGGYGSYPRRMLRLGHISFFGLGMVNFLFALTAAQIGLAAAFLPDASLALILGAATMPVCCGISAIKKDLRHLFPIPVMSVITGLVCLFLSWP